MTTTSSSVEAATASLVREYLSRKGLKGTLQKLDEECPRDEFSISNRQALMKHVHLEKLMKKNKEEPEPLKSMLEIMTKHFMERNPRSSSNTHASGSGTTLQDSFSSTINFSPQTNQPDDFPVMQTMTRPKTAALTSQRGKSSSDLIIDDDVHGETLMGMGKSGVMAADTTESPLQYAVKAQPVRPVSAKQKSGMVITNDDALARRRRSQLAKSGGLSIPQRDQEKRDTNPRSNFNHTGSDAVNGKSSERGHIAKVSSSPDFVYDSFTSPPKNMPKKQSTAEDPPVSFEALLMKGEERANLLQRIGLENKDPINTKESYKVENSSMMEEKPRVKQKTRPEDFSSNATKMMDLEFGDVDDIEDNLGDLELKSAAPMLQKPAKLTKIHSTPIDLKTAIALKNIVLGLPTQQYNDEWLLQSFSFCDMPDLKYGIVQKKGGPCGVLAAVQAFVIQEMLFGESKLPEPRYKNPTRSERSKLLALALSNILWRAGDFSRAVVTLPSQTTHLVSSSKFKQDGVTERLSIYTFTTFEELSSFLIQSVSQFESDGCPGVIMTMYSAILSRKTHQVRGDFDVPEQSTLIGSHGYCTQELVNLLVTGRAVSNVFNDTVQLDSGGIGDTVTLKGISGRSSVGLLSLFEHYKSCQVGTYYKTPKYPIWVVCSESHFSVLFSTRKDLVSDWKAERRFDLIYYDGLARQQEEIKLTVCTINQSYKPPSSEEDLIPPLEHCIRTKWTDAEIDWNGSEPIL